MSKFKISEIQFKTPSGFATDLYKIHQPPPALKKGVALKKCKQRMIKPLSA